MAKISLSELLTRAPTVDRAKLDATTESQIEAYRTEDGYGDRPVPDVIRVVESPQSLRVRLGLTQKEIAAALRIPLVIVSRMPEAAMDALGGPADKSTGTS